MLTNLIDTHIDGDVIVSNNAQLTSISFSGSASPKKGIETIRGDVRIDGNPRLVDLAGLEHLVGAGGSVVARGGALADLSALTNLAGIGGDLQLEPGVLRSAANLSHLAVVGGNVLLSFMHPMGVSLADAKPKISLPLLNKISGEAQARVVAFEGGAGIDVWLILSLASVYPLLTLLHAYGKLLVFGRAGEHSSSEALECMVSAADTITDILFGVYMFTNALWTEINDTVDWRR